jgi:hypothetical protein
MAFYGIILNADLLIKKQLGYPLPVGFFVQHN